MKVLEIKITKSILVLFFAGILNLSCDGYKQSTSNNIIVHHNSLDTTDFSINFNLKFSIPMHNQFSGQIQDCYIIVQNKSKYYIVDHKQAKINIFEEEDNKINYLNNFGTKGAGPGEFESINNLYIFNDTINIIDNNMKLISKFDLFGRFIYRINLPAKIPYLVKNKVFANKYLLGSYSDIEINASNSSYIYNNNNSFFDLHFFEEKVYFSNNIIINPNDLTVNPFDFVAFADFNENNAFIAHISENYYKIDIYNNLEKRETITKTFRKVRMSSNQINAISDIVKTNSKEKNRIIDHYQKSINGLWLDKHDRVWVLSAQDNKDNRVYIDIFKNGKFLNKIELPGIRMEINYDLPDIIHLLDYYLIIIDKANSKILFYDYN